MDTLVHKPDGSLESDNPWRLGRRVRWHARTGNNVEGASGELAEGDWELEGNGSCWIKFDRDSCFAGRTMTASRSNVTFLEE